VEQGRNEGTRGFPLGGARRKEEGGTKAEIQEEGSEGREGRGGERREGREGAKGEGRREGGRAGEERKGREGMGGEGERAYHSSGIRPSIKINFPLVHHKIGPAPRGGPRGVFEVRFEGLPFPSLEIENVEISEVTVSSVTSENVHFVVEGGKGHDSC
jgi:hypothetical protein